MATRLETDRRETVEHRLRKFHDVGIADVLEVVGYLREPGDSVIAGGSLSFGLGNRLSDFDVVVCGRSTDTSLMPLQHWVKSLRVDVWTRAHRDIDAVFALADRALASTAPIAGALGSVEEEQQLKLLHRIAFGLHLDGPPLAPSGGRDHLEVARDLVVREYAERMRESACVAQLAARAGRWLAAAVNARSAVEEALHATLAASGVPFTGDKWLAERLTEVPDLRAGHQDFAVLPEPVDDPAFVAEAIAWCERLTGLDLDADQLRPALRWIHDGLLLHRVNHEDLLVAPDVGGLWQLDSGEAHAWRGLCEIGEAPATGPDRVSFPGGRCTAEQTSLCLRLYERGLLRLDWDRGVTVAELTFPEVAGS
ncbi:hypothetical protein [Gandjariella thermophila]|uniref:Polymerase nucleotidyl transferase domain-containing protein n=1 Tax=Gandjariella thermophila TaxID=1931992 RepID=A0A4D4J4F2_9PSEU|nr:hypothetical protein [Gandjariella thermophila]GDY29628.1 hypothetical protein GTS_12610 [Gandjariella thermophila]